MPVHIQFFGVAAYQIITVSGQHILIDPYLNENPHSPVKTSHLERVDLLLVTHNAIDHLGDAAEILQTFACPVICAKDVMHNLVRYQGVNPDLFRVTIWGMLMEEAGIFIHPVESHHWSFTVAPDGQLLSGPAMGFIIHAAPGVRIYHPGDTALTYDMRLWGKLYRPNVGLMHVTLPEGSLPHMESYKSGELTPSEALLASHWLGLEHIIVSHYVDPQSADVREFLRLTQTTQFNDGWSPRVSVLEPGEILEL